MPQKPERTHRNGCLATCARSLILLASIDYTDAPALYAKYRYLWRIWFQSCEGVICEARDAKVIVSSWIAFSSWACLVYALYGHKTGAAFDDHGAHIIHGAANAMYLPKVIAFNAKDIEPCGEICCNFCTCLSKLGGESRDANIMNLDFTPLRKELSLNIPQVASRIMRIAIQKKQVICSRRYS